MTRYRVLFLTTIIVVSIMMPNTVLASIVRKVNFPKESFSIIKKDGYDKIALDQGFYTFEVGKPELPIRTINLAIPRDVIVTTVNILSVEKKAIEGEYYIYPCQKEYVIGQETQFAHPDAKIYGSKESYPGKIIEFSGHSFVDGIHIASFSFYPLQYLPSEGKLILYTRIKFEVDTEPVVSNESRLRVRAGRSIRDPIRKIVENPEDVHLHTNVVPTVSKPSTLPADDVPYVIITNDQMKSSFQTLANWKTKKGTRTKVISISEVSGYPGVDLAEQIKNFIIDAKNTWDTEWILLGGDVGIIPARYAWFGANDSILTDYYYECLDDMWDSNSNGRYAEREDDPDLLPDIYVGRAPVKTAGGADVVCSKLYNYEVEAPATIRDYQTKALFLSSFMFWENDGQDLNTDLATYVPGYFTKTLHYEYGPATGVAEINSGYNLIVNYSHAQNPGNFLTIFEEREDINYSDIDQLTNNNRFSIMLNVTCKNNKLDFQDYDCLSKHFLSNPTGAGVGYIGSSTKDMPFTSKDLHSVFFDNLFTHGIFGKSLTDSKLHNFSSVNYYYTTERYLMLSYILLGDPQMEIWTETPKDFTLSCPDTVLECGQNFAGAHVESSGVDVESVLVCLLKENDVYEVTYTNSDGIAHFNKSFYPGDASLVASKRNLIPQSLTIEIEPFNEPTNVTATYVHNRIELSWTDNSENEDGFKIERKDTLQWYQIATVGANIENYTDNTVECDHTYCYRLRAYSNACDGYFSYPHYPEAYATTDTCPDPECPFLYVWMARYLLMTM